MGNCVYGVLLVSLRFYAGEDLANSQILQSYSLSPISNVISPTTT